MRCVNATCDRPLTKSETRQGFTHCKACRRDFQNHPFNGALAPKPLPAPTSWWLGLPRDGFTDEARERQQLLIARGGRHG